MMICKADFEELFPHLFECEAHSATKASLSHSDACIARWLDDGGTVITYPAHQKSAGSTLRTICDCNMIYSGFAFATLSAIMQNMSIWATFWNLEPVGEKMIKRPNSHH